MLPLTPNSLRSMWVGGKPHGAVVEHLDLARSARAGDAPDGQVGSQVDGVAAVASAPVTTTVMTGYCSTSKKSGERRCSSRLPIPVSATRP